MTTGIVQEKRINIMDICKINEQIERLEQELAKLKAEATAPSQYELEYKEGSIFLVGYRDAPMRWNVGKDEGHIKTGRYRKTEEFADEHFQAQNEMMRLGALIEAVTIELGMEDWVEDWNDRDQTKYCVRYNHEDNKYGESYFGINRITGVIYMPQKVAERVCKILNNKEYEL
jgi:hypothetical protein